MGLLQTPGPGLMRSKSDHRLATQFRQQEDRDEDVRGGRLSPLAGRKFGERPAPKPAAADRQVSHKCDPPRRYPAPPRAHE